MWRATLRVNRRYAALLSIGILPIRVQSDVMREEEGSVSIARKLLTGLLLVAPFAGAADPALLDLIMPDARVVVGIDVARIRASPLSASFSDGMQNANPELQKLLDAAGFNPMRDLQEILFASPAAGQNPPALLVARGNFDAARLRSFAELAGSKISEWQGVPILSDPAKEGGTFALLDNIIMAGNGDQVKAAIARRGRGMILNAALATRISNMSSRYEVWVVSIAPLAKLAESAPGDANVKGFANLEALKNIDQFSFGVGIKSDITLAAEIVMTNAKSASGLADGIQMLIGMIQQNAKGNPEAMAALKKLNFGVEDNVVHLAITVPAAEVEKAVREAVAKRMTPGRSITADRQAGVAAAAAAQRPAANTPRIPANADIMIQSSPKDMGNVVIFGSKK
jgi:hypothetical protein